MNAEEKLVLEEGVEGRQSGTAISEVCRHYQVHYAQFYRWKRPEPGYGRKIPEATYPKDMERGPLCFCGPKGLGIFW